MSAANPVQTKRGIVKQINSGDSVTIHGIPKGRPPPEKTINLSNITAPKLARLIGRPDAVTKDEPYAWEAREFLRKKLIGQEVTFVEEKSINEKLSYGTVWIGKENVAELLVSEGLAAVRGDGMRNPTPEIQHLQKLEEQAKSAGKGKFSNTPSSEHVRTITPVEDLRDLVDKKAGKPVKAIIEHVRDGSTVKAFLLPEFYHITLMISGIRCKPIQSEVESDPIAKEARFFVEYRLLQRDVEIVLESVSNNNFVGSIFHPKGNIAVLLLEQGFARCVDWSMNHIKYGVDKLYQAEKAAKEKRLRIWKDYVPSGPQIEYNATVIEIASADALIVKTQAGDIKKVFLSSIRPPREKKAPGNEENRNTPRPKDFRPLYDIPWMFEAREFLRKKLIRKPVKVVVDYVQPAKDNFPEKTCCTILTGKVNIAEALVQKGLATVVRYRQNDDQRSSHYNDLLAAESKAEKSQNGLHSKKDSQVHRIIDISNDPAKAKIHQPSLKRAGVTKAVVEFVTSASRLKLFLPKGPHLVTFLLAGIKAPRGPRPAPGGAGGMIEAEPYGEEALAFTKEHCLQRDVDIQVESMESKGSAFIGWLFIDGVNLSVALVEEGLAEVSNYIEQGEHYKVLKAAEERAKAKNLNIWKDRVEVEPEVHKVEEEKHDVERKIDQQKVLVPVITEELHFYAQSVDQGNLLEGLLSQMRQEFVSNPPLPGSYNPKRGEMAAAKFTGDDQWYRCKIEKVSGTNVNVFYIDYGNRETVNVTRVAALPAGFATDKPYATEYILACVSLPSDVDDKKGAIEALHEDVRDRTLLLNVEYKVAGVPAATLVDAATQDDIAKRLILDGYLLVNKVRDKRVAKLLAEYQAAQHEAKKDHRNIWQYGDITEDDPELGIGR